MTSVVPMAVDRLSLVRRTNIRRLYPVPHPGDPVHGDGAGLSLAQERPLRP